MQTSSAHARQVSLHKLHTSVIRVLHGVRKRSKHSFDGSLLTGMVSAQDVQWQHPTSVSAANVRRTRCCCSFVPCAGHVDHPLPMTVISGQIMKRIVSSFVNFCHCCWVELEDFQQLSLRST